MGMASWPHKTWSWTAGGLWAWAGNTRAEPQSSTYILEDPVPVGVVADFRASSIRKVWKLRDRQPRQRQVWNQSFQQQKHPSQVEKHVGDFVS